MDGGAATTAFVGQTPTSVAAPPNDGCTAIHVTALDSILHANSLFTFAAFVGLTCNSSKAAGQCSAGVRAVEHLVTFHVVSFACFLFSSIVALCLKQAMNYRSAASCARINRAVLRAGILGSAAGSTFAVAFLMLALVNLVQVRLGRIGCEGGVAAVAAVAVLLTLVPPAMLIYVGIVLYAFTR